MRCIVCGEDHQPSAAVCDSDGMDREIARLGARRWNALTAHVSRINNRQTETCICGVPSYHRLSTTSAGNETMSDWRPIHTAPRDIEVLLFAAGSIYIGKLRYGALGEPQQNHFGWRAYCCGRFTNPTHWQPLPEPPVSGQSCYFSKAAVHG